MASPAIVNSGNGGSVSSGTTATTTFSAGTGEIIIVSAVVNLSGAGTILISDNSGNSLTWVELGRGYNSTALQPIVIFWARNNGAAISAKTITVTTGAAVDYMSVSYATFSGCNAVQPFDGVTVTGPGDPLSVTTSLNNDTLVAAYRMGSVQTPTAGSGFTLIVGSTYQGFEYKALSAPATTSCTLTTGAGDSNGGVAFALTADASPLQVRRQQWRSDHVEATPWLGSMPKTSLALTLLAAVTVYGVAGQAPTKRWRIDPQGDGTVWQGRPLPAANLPAPLNLIARAPVYAPRPSDHAVWQGSPRANLLTTTLVATATPFKQPAWRFDHSSSDGWQVKPQSSWPIRLLTATTIYGAPGQGPTKQWRCDPQADATVWNGKPQVSTTLRLLSVGGQPPTRQWHCDPQADHTYWRGAPQAAAALNIPAPAASIGRAPVYAPRPHDTQVWNGNPRASAALNIPAPVTPPFAGKRVRLEFAEPHVWTGTPLSANFVLANLLQLYAVPPQWAPDPDHSTPWQFKGQRNLSILSGTAAATPFAGIAWRYNHSESIGWRAQPIPAPQSLLAQKPQFAHSRYVSPGDDDRRWIFQPSRNTVLTYVAPVTFYGAPGQAPTKRWRIDPQADATFWTGSPLYAASLTLPPAPLPAEPLPFTFDLTTTVGAAAFTITSGYADFEIIVASTDFQITG